MAGERSPPARPRRMPARGGDALVDDTHAVSPGSPKEALRMLTCRAGLPGGGRRDADGRRDSGRSACRPSSESTRWVPRRGPRILGAFTAGQGYSRRRGLQPAGLADPQDRGSPRAPRSSLHRVGQAGRHPPAGRRGAGHRGAVGILRPDHLQWTGKLPEDCREAADAILLSAAQAGMDLRDLAGLAAEIYERSRSELPDEDPAQAFEDRAVRRRPLRRRRRDER